MPRKVSKDDVFSGSSGPGRNVQIFSIENKAPGATAFIDPCVWGVPVCHPWRDGERILVLTLKWAEGALPHEDPDSLRLELHLLELPVADPNNNRVITRLDVANPGVKNADNLIGSRTPETYIPDRPLGYDWGVPDAFGWGAPISGSDLRYGMLRNALVFPDHGIVIPGCWEGTQLHAHNYRSRAKAWEKLGFEEVPDLTELEMEALVNTGAVKGPELPWAWKYRLYTPVCGWGRDHVVVNVTEIASFAACLSGPSEDAWVEPPGDEGSYYWPARPDGWEKFPKDDPASPPGSPVPDWYALDPPSQGSIWSKWFYNNGNFGLPPQQFKPVDPEDVKGDKAWYDSAPDPTLWKKAFLFDTEGAVEAMLAEINADWEYALQFFRWNGIKTHQVEERFELLDVRTGAKVSELSVGDVQGRLQVDRENVNGLAKIAYFKTLGGYHNQVPKTVPLTFDPIDCGPYEEEGYVPSAGSVAGDTGWNVYCAGILRHYKFQVGGNSHPAWCFMPADSHNGIGPWLGVHSSTAEYPRTAHQWYPLRPYASGGRRYSQESRPWPSNRHLAVASDDLLIFMPRYVGGDASGLFNAQITNNDDRRNLVRAYRLPGWELAWEVDLAEQVQPVPNFYSAGGVDSGLISLDHGALLVTPVVTATTLYLAAGFKPGGNNYAWTEVLFEISLKTGQITDRRTFTGIPTYAQFGVYQPMYQVFGGIFGQLSELQMVQSKQDESDVLIWQGTYAAAQGQTRRVIRRLRGPVE